MCTALYIKNNDTFLFGRNMDIPYNFNQSPIIVPRNYQYTNKVDGSVVTIKQAIMGIGTEFEGHPLYAEAMNEFGLAIAGLNYPNAIWNEVKENKDNIAPYDLTLWILNNFKTVKEVMGKINDINLVNIPVSDKLALPTLHFIISDLKGDCIVIEQDENGFNCYDNPFGVLSNAPNFKWHLENVKNYLNLSANDIKQNNWNNINIKAYGTGNGLIGMPGDFYSSSRFIRAAFFRAHLKFDNSKYADINGYFQILDNVKMIKGSVHTEHLNSLTVDYTLYSSCLDLKNRILFYKTYENQQVSMIRMDNEVLEGNKLIKFPYLVIQTYNELN